jgi:serine/threonine-protein kinase HipA
MDKTGAWKLSPAYDVCYSYRPGSTWVSQQSLSVNGKRQNITGDDFIAVAKRMNIKKAAKIITQINEVVNNWPKYAEETKVNPVLRDAINKTLIHLNNSLH